MVPQGFKPSPFLTPNALEQRKAALVRQLTSFHPYNSQRNIPGQVDTSPPIQALYTGAATGGALSGVPAAQTSSVNPTVQALANVRGAY